MKYVTLLLLCILLTGCNGVKDDAKGWVHIKRMEVVANNMVGHENDRYAHDRDFIVFKHNNAIYRLRAQNDNIPRTLIVGGVYDLDYHTTHMTIGAIHIAE